MKNIKYFIGIAGASIKQKFCKHSELDKSSCPFTGRTYTTCIKCFKRLNVEVTK